MNRRHKKKQEVDYLGLVKAKVSAIDFSQAKTQALSAWSSLPALHRKVLLVLVPVVAVLAVIPLPAPSSAVKAPATNARVELEINTVGLSAQKSDEQKQLKSNQWHEYTVKSGDTLAQVFRNNELPLSDLNALVKIEGGDKPLSRIKQGQLVRFKLAETGQLDILQLEKNDSSVMFFRLSDGGFGRSK
ncbi:lysine transporter LysM [Vibrio makurazakiensis]|uniref:LysM-like peptidoglycan-binding domain-containing protein n=1 Tax=Vibrio makurazakiensis TaxID=2910250 RepID=UPI003D118C1B